MPKLTERQHLRRVRRRPIEYAAEKKERDAVYVIFFAIPILDEIRNRYLHAMYAGRERSLRYRIPPPALAMRTARNLDGIINMEMGVRRYRIAHWGVDPSNSTSFVKLRNDGISRETSDLP